MESKYFSELTRRLDEDGIKTRKLTRSKLPVLLHGQTALHITQSSDVFLMPEASGRQETGKLCHKVSELAAIVKEYTPAIERVPMLQARALDGPFHALDRNETYDRYREPLREAVQHRQDECELQPVAFFRFDRYTVAIRKRRRIEGVRTWIYDY